MKRARDNAPSEDRVIQIGDGAVGWPPLFGPDEDWLRRMLRDRDNARAEGRMPWQTLRASDPEIPEPAADWPPDYDPAWREHVFADGPPIEF